MESTVEIPHLGTVRFKILHDDGSWFAEGIDIDYAAEGPTLEEARYRFQAGLTATVEKHVELYGHANRLKREPSQ